jgi:hypothetical protein
MEVSAKKLSEAHQLVREIKSMDYALGQIKAGQWCRTLVWYDCSDGRVELTLPGDIAQGLIRTMRFHALVKLSETGVVSTSSGHRPVVSA